MTRCVVGLLLAGVVAGVAAANVPPPRDKVVPVDATVKLEKELKGYVLYLNDYGGGVPTRFEVGTDKAVPLPFREQKGVELRQGVELLAVPEGVVAKLKTAEDWKAARYSKTSVIHAVGLGGTTSIRAWDERKQVQKNYVIRGVDPKSGFNVVEVEEKKPEANKDKPLASVEAGYLVGGGAAALAVSLGGLWLVRRRK
jgi:hypothetical protein